MDKLYKALSTLKSRISSSLNVSSIKETSSSSSNYEIRLQFSEDDDDNEEENYQMPRFFLTIHPSSTNVNGNNNNTFLIQNLEASILDRFLRQYSSKLQLLKQDQDQDSSATMMIIPDVAVNIITDQLNSTPILFGCGKLDPRSKLTTLATNNNNNNNNTSIIFISNIKGTIERISPQFRSSTNPMFAVCQNCKKTVIPSCLFDNVVRYNKYEEVKSEHVVPSFLASNLVSGYSSSSSSSTNNYNNNNNNNGRRTFFVCDFCQKQQVFSTNHQQTIKSKATASTCCTIENRMIGVQTCDIIHQYQRQTYKTQNNGNDENNNNNNNDFFTTMMMMNNTNRTPSSSSFSQKKNRTSSNNKEIIDMIVFDSSFPSTAAALRLGQNITFSGFYCQSSRVMICHSLMKSSSSSSTDDPSSSSPADNNNHNEEMKKPSVFDHHHHLHHQSFSSTSSLSSLPPLDKLMKYLIPTPSFLQEKIEMMSQVNHNNNTTDDQTRRIIEIEDHFVENDANLLKLFLLASCLFNKNNNNTKNNSSRRMMILLSSSTNNSDEVLRKQDDQRLNSILKFISLLMKKQADDDNNDSDDEQIMLDDDDSSISQSSSSSNVLLFPHWKTKEDFLTPADAMLSIRNSAKTSLACGKLFSDENNNSNNNGRTRVLLPPPSSTKNNNTINRHLLNEASFESFLLTGKIPISCSMNSNNVASTGNNSFFFTSSSSSTIQSSNHQALKIGSATSSSSLFPFRSEDAAADSCFVGEVSDNDDGTTSPLTIISRLEEFSHSCSSSSQVRMLFSSNNNTNKNLIWNHSSELARQNLHQMLNSPSTSQEEIDAVNADFEEEQQLSFAMNELLLQHKTPISLLRKIIHHSSHDETKHKRETNDDDDGIMIASYLFQLQSEIFTLRREHLQQQHQQNLTSSSSSTTIISIPPLSFYLELCSELFSSLLSLRKGLNQELLFGINNNTSSTCNNNNDSSGDDGALEECADLTLKIMEVCIPCSSSNELLLKKYCFHQQHQHQVVRSNNNNNYTTRHNNNNNTMPLMMTMNAQRRDRDQFPVSTRNTTASLSKRSMCESLYQRCKQHVIRTSGGTIKDTMIIEFAQEMFPGQQKYPPQTLLEQLQKEGSLLKSGQFGVFKVA